MYSFEVVNNSVLIGLSQKRLARFQKFKFLAYLESIRSYALSNGHSDPNLSSLNYVSKIVSGCRWVGGCCQVLTIAYMLGGLVWYGFDRIFIQEYYSIVS